MFFQTTDGKSDNSVEIGQKTKTTDDKAPDNYVTDIFKYKSINWKGIRKL
jgi:hypothetical protein